MFRATILIWVLVGLVPMQVTLADQVTVVSRLEAGHVAEIHTGAVADSINLETRNGMPIFVVGTRVGNKRFRSEIHGVHGRLLSIAQMDGALKQAVYEWPGIRVVAHRGGALLGPPENTIPAIEKAVEVGADLIEIDIRQTRDGHLVLMHDETVDRTTDGVGRVDQMTLSQVKRLKVRHDGNETVRVPTLKQALQAMKGKIDPDLDFKDGDLQPLLQVVRNLEISMFSTMYGSWDRCLEVVQQEPNIRIRPSADYPQQVPELARTLRPAIVNLDWHSVTEEAVRLAHLLGCHAFVNCLEIADTEFCIEKAIEIGADYIQSDRPDLVIEMLKRRGMRRNRPERGDVLETPLRNAKLQYPLK